MQRMMCRLIFLGLVYVLLSGCVPFPNVHRFAPAISGVVLRDGRPVPSAVVKVSAQFSREVRTVTTDQDGRFSTEAIRELRWTAILLGDPLFGYTVQIGADGHDVAGYQFQGIGSAPSDLRLSCDLAKPVRVVGALGFCGEVAR